jgi:hypothetical protein
MGRTVAFDAVDFRGFFDLLFVLDLLDFPAPDFARLDDAVVPPTAFRARVLRFVFLLAFTLRTPVTAAVFLTFATSSPRLCNGRRVVSGSFRYGNLGVVVTYVNGSPA